MSKVLDLTLSEFLDDYNWKYIFEHHMNPCGVLGYKGDLTPFAREDVSRIWALSEGEGDGDDWVGVFFLKDGRYASITGGCDYSGWG